MADFQNTVRINQTTGVIGEIILSGPSRAQPAILSSTAAANNVVGRAFRHVALSDTDVTADAAGVFAGILVNPKVYATSGTSIGTLEPTLTLPNETEAEFLTMGMIIVDVTLDATTNTRRQIGDEIYYQDTTGRLTSVQAGTAAGAGFTRVPTGVIIRNNVDGSPGLAIIQLTN